MPLPPEYLRHITREEMNALPIRRYEGEVHLVESPQMLERAAADILREAVVGFDTETRPAFRKGESHLPSLAQVATARAVYLFPLQRLDCSAMLGELLGAPHIVNAGVALADDLRQLRQLFAFEAAAALDLGHVARRHGLKQTGLRNLTGIFLGTRIPKGTKTTNWAAPRLTPQQVTYAATDAWACRELYLKFAALNLL
ncbi:MAG: 3'-5' exonuclease [Burkholderiales bacterium]